MVFLEVVLYLPDLFIHVLPLPWSLYLTSFPVWISRSQICCHVAAAVRISVLLSAYLTVVILGLCCIVRFWTHFTQQFTANAFFKSNCAAG